MKKHLLCTILMVTVFSVVTATGCGTTTQNTATQESTSTSTNTEGSENVITPLSPIKTAEDALADGGYSVSFGADDLIKKDDGYELTIELKDLPDAIKNSEISFNCNNTVITVRQGQVAQIIRY